MVNVYIMTFYSEITSVSKNVLNTYLWGVMRMARDSVIEHSNRRFFWKFFSLWEIEISTYPLRLPIYNVRWRIRLNYNIICYYVHALNIVWSMNGCEKKYITIILLCQRFRNFTRKKKTNSSTTTLTFEFQCLRAPPPPPR